MFRETLRKIALLEFSEVGTRERGAGQRVHVLPGFFLIAPDVDLFVHADREKIAAGELRIAGVFVRPRLQRFVGEIDFVDDIRIGRIIARANVFVVERVVDTEIAHLHPSEVFVSGSGVIERLACIVCVFAL